MAAKKTNLGGLFKKEKEAQKTASTTRDPYAGKVSVVFRMSQDGKKQLDFLAVETGRQKQDLLCEALNDFLLKHGKQPTA